MVSIVDILVQVVNQWKCQEEINLNYRREYEISPRPMGDIVGSTPRRISWIR